jgi:hypothetical protein
MRLSFLALALGIAGMVREIFSLSRRMEADGGDTLYTLQRVGADGTERTAPGLEEQSLRARMESHGESICGEGAPMASREHFNKATVLHCVHVAHVKALTSAHQGIAKRFPMRHFC